MIREPLSAGELFALKPGDKFRVYWEKDDNPEDIRFNYRLFTVVSNNGETIETDSPGISFYRSGVMTEEENALDFASRGYAYLYKVQP